MSTGIAYRRPDWVRRINAMGVCAGSPRELVSLDPDEMIATARRTTGLSDFGPDNWRASYAKLIDALEAEAGLHTLGRLMTRAEILRCLRMRLLLAEALRRDPEIAARPVRAPIMICGPSRSGTSISFELLAQDENLRAPLAFEALHPLPYPGAVTPEQRSRLGECEQEFWEDVQPEFAAIHELRSDLPVECITIMGADFHLAQWSTEVDVPSFSGWAAGQDPAPSYAFHRSVLQVLQGPTPQTSWLLKSPGHLGSLPSVFEIYPDVKIVHTHRDPVKTIPSTVSTTYTTRWLRTDHVKVETLAQGVDLGFQAMLSGVAEARKNGALPEERFGDLHFKDLMRDPAAAVEKLYDDLGLPFSSRFADRIRAYLAAKPEGKHGKHRYAPEDWGFTTQQLRQAYLPYTDHYGIELEA